MGKRRTVIKCVALTCCLGLLIGAGRANNEEVIEEREIPIYTVAEKRSVKASVHVMEEPDSGIRESNETGEEAIEYAGMDGQDLPSGETEAETEVPEPEPEDIGTDAADTGITEEGSGTGYTAEDSGTGYAAEDGEGESDTAVSDMETGSSAGWDGGIQNDSTVSEMVESEYSDETGYEGSVDNELEQGNTDNDSNEQYGGSEYSEDSGDGYSDGEEPEPNDELLEEAVGGSDGSTGERIDEEVDRTGGSDGGAGESDSGDSGTENLTHLGTWVVSFYDACVECTGSGNGITASGTYAQPWHTAATSGLEFGTTLYVDGLGYFVVEDRGTEYGWLDVFVSDHSEALALGLQSREVYLVN